MILGPAACNTSSRLRKSRCTLIAAAAFSALPSLCHAGDFASCLLDKLPGLQNDAAAEAALTVCHRGYPGGFTKVEAGSGRGFFGYGSGAECTLEKAKDTASRRAGALIRSACNRLYDEPAPWGEYDVLGPTTGN